MKYDYTDGTSVESNITDEGTRMGISPDAIAHVINVLTDLYSDPAGAAIRESATNGLDAQKAEGVTEPLRVFLPTEFSSVYEVIDRGTGMSAHTLRHEFGQYGWSSKRDSNEFNGMLGLGCKAPLTYTPQFTVVSVKDGLKNTAIIERGEDGVGRVRIPDELHDVPTDEENGTTVQIPVIDVDSFNKKARQFFRFWDPGSVLINGEAPETVWEDEDVIALDEDVLLVPKSAVEHSDRVHVVMAGVTYPLDYDRSSKVTRELSYGTTVVARIPTGSVNIPGNREALQYTAKTEDLVATLAAYVSEATERRFREKVSAALTAAEAMDVAEEARSVLRRFDPTWQGHTVPSQLRATQYSRGAGSVGATFGMRWTNSDNLWNVTANDLKTTSHNIPDTEKTLVVNGYTNSSVSAVNKAKVQQWMGDNGLAPSDVREVLFRESKTSSLSIWLDGSSRVVFAPWEEVKAVDLPDSVRSAAGYTPPSRSSSRTSTAAPSDDLSEVREVKSDGGYRVIERDTVVARSNVLMLAPSDKTKTERESLFRKANPLGVTIIVVNKSRHDEAFDLFDDLMSLDEFDSKAEKILRERYEALPILDASYRHEFGWQERGWGTPKASANDLLNRANRIPFFANDHHVQMLQAMIARIDRAEAARGAINEFLRVADNLYGYGEDKPVYVEALRQWVRDADNRNRHNLDDLIKSKVTSFHATYTLFEPLERDTKSLGEYARLLSA